MNRQQIYQAALSTVASRRQRAVTLAKEREAAFMARVPEWAELQSAKTQAGIRAAVLGAGAASAEAVQDALTQVAHIDKIRATLLAENGLREADLLPAYTCPLCKDSGFSDDTLCACVHAEVRALRQQQINATSPLSLCSFERFSLSKYPQQHIPELGMSAREHMSQILAYCKAYANNFSTHSVSLYLCGYAGLGKTHLALSIARTVLEQGYDVVYVSAQDAFDNVERERFGDADGGTLQTLQSADLLILDDLGTEYISPYVSACLYSLINTRSNRSMPTIYTSNILKDADLRRRYTEKIASRLLGACEVLSFCGEDIRLQGK